MLVRVRVGRLVGLLSAVLLGSTFVHAVAEPPAAETLVVFVQPGKSEAARHFEQSALPELRKLADSLGIALQVIDVGAAGAPPEVVITPLITFQNHRGRSIYQGRYTTLDRVRSFVRTSRASPQKDEPLARTVMPTWEAGRAKITAPLKVAAVTGKPPRGYDAAAFEKEMTAAVLGGFERLQLAERVTLSRGDRAFYMDFYPWAGDDGTIYLTLKLFSQFHCHKPVFETGKQPLTAKWADRAKLYRDAAGKLERAMLETISASTLGDGFDPVDKGVALRTWEELGLPLPPAPPESGVKPAEASAPLASAWKVAGSADEARPPVLFHFAPPLESYLGEVRSISGELRFGDGGALNGLSGSFEGDLRTLSMGEPDLDAALQDSTFLDTKKFPASRFTVKRVQDVSGGGKLAWGELTSCTLEGELALKGVSTPATLRATFEPQLGADGKPELHMAASFELRIEPFKLEGPPGPDPANQTMVFDAFARLVPAAP